MKLEVLHRDGSISYFSIYKQQWIQRACNMPDEELAARSGITRTKIIKHMEEKRAR